jgi:hypothetical protein
MERVEGSCQWGGEEEGGVAAKGVERVEGRLPQLGEGAGGDWGGGGGRAPIHRIEIKGPNLLSHLSS